MSKLLVDVQTLDLHPPHDASALPAQGAHLGLTHRAALHVGLWLLLRSTRRAAARTDHDHRARLVANEHHRSTRDAASLRLHQLGPRT